MIYHVPNNKDNLFADRNVINHAPTRCRVQLYLMQRYYKRVQCKIVCTLPSAAISYAKIVNQNSFTKLFGKKVRLYMFVQFIVHACTKDYTRLYKAIHIIPSDKKV